MFFVCRLFTAYFAFANARNALFVLTHNVPLARLGSVLERLGNEHAQRDLKKGFIGLHVPLCTVHYSSNPDANISKSNMFENDQRP